MTPKFFVAGVAAVAAIGSAAAGVTSISAVSPGVHRMQLAVLAAPLPLDPVADMPSPGQLINVLNALQDTSVPFADKTNLIEGGFAPFQGQVADAKLRQAAQNGELPLSFSIANIQPAGANTATADVTATGPQLAPLTQNMTFTDEGGWKVSREGALSLLHAAEHWGS